MKTLNALNFTFKIFNGKSDFTKYLNYLDFNRPYNVRPQMVDSIKEHGFIDPILIVNTDVIDGMEKLYIVDGQHRALAASYLDVPFTAAVYKKTIKTKKDAVELVSMMHRTHKGWTIHNYVHAYASLGYQDYIDLHNIHKNNPYSISSIANIFGGFIGRSDLSSIRSGEYKMKSKDHAEETIKQANKLDKLMTGRMLVSFHKVRLLVDTFNFSKFKEEFELNYKELKANRYDDFFQIFKSYVQ